MTASLPRGVRWAAAAAALVLAVLSRGDAAVLALALVLAAGRPWAVVAVGPAMAAVAWRWGATSLEALAGYQSVLGPAGWTGSAPRAASAWLAAAALLLATPLLGAGPRATRPPRRHGGTPRLSGLGRTPPSARAGSRGPDGRLRAVAVIEGADEPVSSPAAPAARTGSRGPDGRLRTAEAAAAEVGGEGGAGPVATGGGRGRRWGGWWAGVGDLVGAGAFGAAAAVVVAGPGPGGDVWVRVVATVMGVALALGAVALRGRWERWVDGGAAVAGVVALALVAGADPPSFVDAFDAGTAARGLAIAVAVAATVGVADQAWRARSGRRPA